MRVILLPPSTRSDARRNRETIVAAAIVTLDTDPEASVDTIAAAAGVSRRAVYRHFGSKDTLIMGVTQALLKRAMISLTGLSKVGVSVDVQLAAGAGRLWDSLGDRKRLLNYRLNGKVRKFAFAQAAPLRELLRDLLQTGQAEGTVRTDLSVDAIQFLIETHAAALLEVAVESPLSTRETRDLFVLSLLADIGLSAKQAREFLIRNSTALKAI
jgi:AcrR family transcriptional regulator